ncbi:hypothetical protein PV797_05725 [Clostridiaceae bacterium M8S5]|nr:hypothetical protein PV797_05725 [Clostridiaceae bacterium M8S5]
MTYKQSINFILGLILNQSQESQKSWNAAIELQNRFYEKSQQYFSFYLCEFFGVDFLYQIIKGNPCLHRFPETMSRYIVQTAATLNRYYQGDPRKLWENNPSNINIELQKLHGIGKHKAIQGKLILFRILNLPFENKDIDYMNINCSAMLDNLERDIKIILQKNSI